MRQKKLLSVLLAGAMVVSGGSISGLEGIIPEVAVLSSLLPLFLVLHWKNLVRIMLIHHL